MKKILPCFLLLINFFFSSCNDKIDIQAEQIEDVSSSKIDSIIPDTSRKSGSEIIEDVLPIPTFSYKSISNSDLTGVSFVSGDLGYVSGDSGVVLKTTDGGKTFVSINTGTTEFLYDTWFFSEKVGLVAGNKSSLLRTVDGGLTWVRINTNINSDYRSLYFVDEKVGFLCGSDGVILKTIDQGLTWKRVFVGQLEFGIYGIYFLNEFVGYASGRGGAILKTIDSGDTWSKISVSNISEQEILTSITFTDNYNGFAVGGNPLLRQFGNSILLNTSDGGITWKRIPLPVVYDYLASVSFFNNKTGFIIGGNIQDDSSSVMRTIDGGKSWTVVSEVKTSRLYRGRNEGNSLYIVGLKGAFVKIRAI